VVMSETSVDYASRNLAQDRLHRVIFLGTLCKALSVSVEAPREIRTVTTFSGYIWKIEGQFLTNS
jgi:hypothetical protein